MVKVVRTRLVFHWGSSIKHPFFSASQPAYKVPLPTSLLGALAYALARNSTKTEIVAGKDGIYSSTAEILDVVPWVTYRIENINPALLVETRDISRVLLAPYVRSDNVYPGSPYVWAVQTHGKVYAPALTLDVLYIVANEKASEIAKHVWGIVRVGTKESIVSVQSVEIRDAQVVEERRGETRYIFPRLLVDEVLGEYLTLRLSSISKEWYRLGTVRNVDMYMQEYIVPIESVRVSLSSDGVFLKVEDLGFIPIPRGVVSS